MKLEFGSGKTPIDFEVALQNDEERILFIEQVIGDRLDLKNNTSGLGVIVRAGEELEMLENVDPIKVGIGIMYG